MISLKETLNQIGVKISAIISNLGDVQHRTLLWTNPNPTSDFPAQTITLSQSLSNFDAYEVLYQQSSSGGGERLMTQIGLVGSGFILICPLDNNRFRASSVIPSGTSMGFEGGRIQVAIGSLRADDTVCVPYKVFGIKYGWGTITQNI